MNSCERSAQSVVVSDQIPQIGIEEPACRDIAKDVFVGELGHQRSAVDETAADGIAILMPVRSRGIDRRDRREDAGDGQRVRIRKRSGRVSLAAGPAIVRIVGYKKLLDAFT